MQATSEIFTPCLDRLEYMFGERLLHLPLTEKLRLQGCLSVWLADLAERKPIAESNFTTTFKSRFAGVTGSGTRCLKQVWDAMPDLTRQEGLFLLRVLTVLILEEAEVKPKRKQNVVSVPIP